VLRLRHQLAMTRSRPQNVAAQPQPAFHPLVAGARTPATENAPVRVASTSYGWGTF
jgi:hypothetical protein